MKKIALTVLISAAIGLPIAADATQINSGYQYTDYNSNPVNYYNHQYALRRTTYNPYTYPVYYPQYYPQYYPIYYTVPQRPVCNESNYRGRYYESWNRSPNCSDRLEDWGNRANLPNEFLSTMYGSDNY